MQVCEMTILPNTPSQGCCHCYINDKYDQDATCRYTHGETGTCMVIRGEKVQTRLEEDET